MSQKKTIKILFVDDHKTVLETCKFCFELIGGYEVHLANDGYIAIKKIKKIKFDIIVTDESMPIISGSELLKMIRGGEIEGDIDPQIPIVLTTGYGRKFDNELNERTIQFPKPFDAFMLEAKVVRILSDLQTERNY